MSLFLMQFYYRFQEQESGGWSLTKGERRYVELLLRESAGNDHVELSFKNPENGLWSPMSSIYLERSH